MGGGHAIGLSVLAVTVTLSSAATHYVRSGGAGDGTDWDNAYGALPADLTRGDTYYVADGAYGGYTFDDAGSEVITIRKATATDHGTDAGWQEPYGDGVAGFGVLVFAADGYAFDGQTGGGPGSWRSGHGFEVSGPGASGLVIFDDGVEGAHLPIDKVTLSHVHIHGPSVAGFNDDSDLNDYARGIDGTRGKATNLTVDHCYLHDMATIHVYMNTWDTVLFEYNCFERNVSTALWHGESFTVMGSDNVTLRYNVWDDCRGTAVLAGINTGTGPGGTVNENWYIYGNIVKASTHFIYLYKSGTNDQSAADWNILNNTIVGPGRGNIAIQSGTGVRIGNNLWYDFREPDNYMAYLSGTVENCTLYDVDFRGDLPSGAVQKSGDPFVDPNGGDFGLREASLPGTTLEAPYVTDMFGNPRGADGTWDRGAIEYAEGHVSALGGDHQVRERRPTTVFGARRAPDTEACVYDISGARARHRENAGVYLVREGGRVRRVTSVR